MAIVSTPLLVLLLFSKSVCGYFAEEPNDRSDLITCVCNTDQRKKAPSPLYGNTACQNHKCQGLWCVREYSEKKAFNSDNEHTYCLSINTPKAFPMHRNYTAKIKSKDMVNIVCRSDFCNTATKCHTVRWVQLSVLVTALLTLTRRLLTG